MAEPRTPDAGDDRVSMPCGTTVPQRTFDMGMRDFDCDCGHTHAVVMDVHPLSRWIPEAVADVFRETIEPTDEYDEFNTIHLMGMVLEEYPDAISVVDASDQPSVGYAILWITEMDSRRLHRIVVELLVELMDHAVGHASDKVVQTDFETHLADFDVAEFVDTYRSHRDFGNEHDRPI